MSKYLNWPLALGIFLIGLFSANVSQAQSTNVYWKPSTGLGGAGSWSSSGAFWSTNSDGSGTLASPTTLGTNIIYNFSGTAGLVNETGSFTVAGVNWSTTGYTWSNAITRTLTGVDATATGTNDISIANNANLNITGSAWNFEALGMTGGSGSTVTLTNATGATTTVIFGTSLARSGRTNSVNTIISGAGTVILGSTGNGGFTQAGTIVNNSTGSFILTNGASSSANAIVAVNGVVSGTGGLSLINTGIGKILLSASNNYSGGTILNSVGGGEIIFSNAASFGTGTITSSGSGTNFVRNAVNGLDLANALVINAGNTLRMGGTSGTWSNIVSGQISGAGALQYNPSGAGNMYLTRTDNSFGGGVTLGSSGTLYVSKFGTNGQNSSLGTSGTISVGLAGQNSANGTLRWTGSGDETSDKVINLNSSTNGVNIYANGAANATLSLDGAIVSVAAGSKSFNFQGASNNTLILNGLINENSGQNSFVIGGAGSGTVVLGNANNSFSGAITITNAIGSQNTILRTANIGNAGANSALGQNGTITFASTNNTAGTILRYTGTGETSDKVLNIAGTTTVATLDQSGAGNLKFTSAMTATGVGAKAITLQGSTAGTGELAADISNLGGNVTSLNKSGSGAWTLSGTNTYTGNTTISAGTLKIGLTNGLVNGVLLGNSSTGSGSTLDMTAAGNYVMNSYGASSATYGQSMVFTNSSGGGGNYTLTFTNLNNYVSGGAAAGRTLNNASANLTVAFTGAVDIGSSSNNEVTFTGPGGFTINGSLTNSLAGVRGLTKSGDGTLTLNAASGYNGTTTLSSGTIALGANGTLGTNSVIMSGGTLAVGTSSSTIKDLTVNNGTITGTGTLTSTNFTFANTSTAGVSATLAGSAVLTKSGAGATTLSGNNSYSGLTTVSAGTLTLSGNNSTASGGVTLTAGTLNINNNNALGSGRLTLTAGTINNTSGAAVVNEANNAVTLASGLSFGTLASNSSNDLDLGTGTVTVSTSRTLTLLGAETTLKMGTLENTSANTDRTFTFNGTGNTMLFRGFNIATTTATATTNSLAGSANLTISGVIANGNLNANGVNIRGTGTTTFSGANTYTGGTEVFSGATLVYGANNVTSDTGGQMAVSGTLDIASYNDTVSSVKVNAGGLLRGTTGVLTASSFDITDANTVSANLGGSSATLDKGGQGTVTLLSGANTYGGKTTIDGGTIKLGSNTALGSTAGATTVGTGGFLDLNGQTGVAEALNYTGTGGLLNSAAGTTATVSGAVDIGSGMTVETVGDITLSGQLTGSVSKNLTKSGAGTLKFTASNSTFTGTNKVSGGTLLVTQAGNVSSSSSIVNEGGTLRVNGRAGGVTVNLGGSLEGIGTVGAVTLTTGSYLKPGNSPGLLTASSSSSWAGGSYYNWEINDADGAAGTNWDVFYVSGADGALDLSDLSGSNRMNLVLQSLSLDNLPSTTLANYSTSTSYEWVIAKAAIFTGIGAGTQDLTSLFNINSAAFNGGAAANLPNGGFQVVASGIDSNNLRTLSLMAIPEPSTGSMFGLGLAGLVVTRLLRRKNS